MEGLPGFFKALVTISSPAFFTGESPIKGGRRGKLGEMVWGFPFKRGGEGGSERVGWMRCYVLGSSCSDLSFCK